MHENTSSLVRDFVTQFEGLLCGHTAIYNQFRTSDE